MRAVADPVRGVVRAAVDIEATPEVVFAAITEPAQLASWWGADLYRTYDWRLDLRPGGRWSVETEGAGVRNSVRGEVLEVDRPRRPVLTWEASWDGFARTVITYTLAATALGTRLTVVHEGFAGRPESCRGHAEGWHQVLGWLEGFARGGA